MELKSSERLGLGPAIEDPNRRGVIDPVAIRKLALGPQEAFLLSRIEGPVSLSDLCLMCGLDLATGTKLVQRLVGLKVIKRLDLARPRSTTAKVAGSKSEPVKSTVARGNKRSMTLRQRAKTRKMEMLRKQIHSGVRRSEPADRVPLVSVSVDPAKQRANEEAEARRQQARARGRSMNSNKGFKRSTRVSSKDARPRSTTCPVDLSTSSPDFVPRWANTPLDEAQLDEALAISIERQRTLLRMSSMLDELNPFELLGIAYCDDTSEIRRAFHQQSRWLHPDAYHGKDLGAYRELLERVFTKVRQGYDGLQNAQERQRYGKSR